MDPNGSKGVAYSPVGYGTGGSGTGTGSYGTSPTNGNESPLAPYLAYAEYHTEAIQPVVFVDYLGLVPVYQDQTDALNDVLGSFAELATATTSETEDLTTNETVVTQVLDGTLTVLTVMTGTHTSTVDATTGNVVDQVVMTYDITTTFDDATGHDFALHQWGDQTLYFEFIVTPGVGTSGTDTSTAWSVTELRHDHYEFVMSPDFTDPIDDNTESTTDNWTRNITGTIDLAGNQSSVLLATLVVTTDASDAVIARDQSHNYTAHSDVSDDITVVMMDRSADLNSAVMTTTIVDSFDHWTAKSKHNSNEVQGQRTSVVEEYHVVGDGLSTTSFRVDYAVQATKSSAPPTNPNSGTTGTTTPVVTTTVIGGYSEESSNDKYSFLAYGSVGTLASGGNPMAYSKYDDDAYGSSTLNTLTSVTITQGTTKLSLTDDPFVTESWTSNAHGYGSSVSVANPDWSGTAGWTKWSAPVENAGTGGTSTTPPDPPEPVWLTNTGSAWAQYDDTSDTAFDSTTTTGTEVLADDGKGTQTKSTSDNADNKVHTFGDAHSISKSVDTETQTAVGNINFDSTSLSTAWGQTDVETAGKTTLEVTNTTDNSKLVSTTTTSGKDHSSDWSQSDSHSYGNSTTHQATGVRVSWDDTTTDDKAYGSSTSEQGVGNVTKYDRVQAADDYEHSSSAESTSFQFDTPNWTSNGSDHSFSKTTSTPSDVDGDGKIAKNREYVVDFQLDSDSTYDGTSTTNTQSTYGAMGKTDWSIRGVDGSLTTYTSESLSSNTSKGEGTNNSLGDSHLRLTDSFAVGGKATTGSGGTNSQGSTAKIDTWSHDESHATSEGTGSFFGQAKAKYEVTDITSKVAAVAPPPPNAPPLRIDIDIHGVKAVMADPAIGSGGVGSGAANGFVANTLYRQLFETKKAIEIPYVTSTTLNTRYGMLYETDDQQMGSSTTTGFSDVVTDVAQGTITTKIDAEDTSNEATTYSTVSHQNVTEDEMGSSTRKFRSGFTTFTTVDTTLHTEQDVVESASGSYTEDSGSKTHLVIVATPNPAANPTNNNGTGNNNNGNNNGTGGTTQTNAPPPPAYLYDIQGTVSSWNNASDIGSDNQSQSSASEVGNLTSREESSSSYTNSGTHDVQEHSTFDATYAGGDTPSTKVRDWSTDIQDGTYDTTAFDSFDTSWVTATGSTLSGNGNAYEESGTLWTKVETDETTETGAGGSSTQTILGSYDTKQTFNYGVGVELDQTIYSGSSSVSSALRFDDVGFRNELTHSEDKFVITTPATKTAAILGTAVTSTQSSKSHWGLTESSDTTMKFTVDATSGIGSGTASFVTNITVLSENRVKTVNKTGDYDSFGDSTLDIAVDGTKTMTDSSWRETESLDREGFGLIVTGTFSDPNGSGSMLLGVGSLTETKGHDTTSVLNGHKHHVRDDKTISGENSAFSMSYGGANVACSMSSGSGSALFSQHRLEEEFWKNGDHAGYEWHTSKGGGGSSSSSSVSVNVGGTWYTSTTSTSEATDLIEAKTVRIFDSRGLGGYGSSGGGYGSSGDSTGWMLTSLFRTNKGSTGSTGASPDGSSWTSGTTWDSTLSSGTAGSGGTMLHESTGYGWSSSTTVPNEDPYGTGTAGSTTTTDGWSSTSPLEFDFEVGEGQALSLTLGGLTGGGMAVRSSFSSPGGGGGAGAPSGAGGAFDYLSGAFFAGAAARGTGAPTRWFAPGALPTAFGGRIERGGAADPTPNPAANADKATAAMGGGASPDLGGAMKPRPIRRTPLFDDYDNDGSGPERTFIGGEGDDGSVVRTVKGVKYIASAANARSLAADTDLTKEGWDNWFKVYGTKADSANMSDLYRTAKARLRKLDDAIARGLKPATIKKLAKEAGDALKPLITNAAPGQAFFSIPPEPVNTSPPPKVPGLTYSPVVGTSKYTVEDAFGKFVGTYDSATGNISRCVGDQIVTVKFTKLEDVMTNWSDYLTRPGGYLTQSWDSWFVKHQLTSVGVGEGVLPDEMHNAGDRAVAWDNSLSVHASVMLAGPLVELMFKEVAAGLLVKYAGGEFVGFTFNAAGKLCGKIRVKGKEVLEELSDNAVRLFRKTADDGAKAGNPTGKQASEWIRSAPKRAVDPQAVVNALSGYNSDKYLINGVNVVLDKSGLKHILERHHPEFWDGTVKAAQSFFPKHLSVSEIRRAIGEVLKQNRERVAEIGPNGVGQIEGVVNGVRYVLGLNRGLVSQFYAP
ncbi:MAG: hypothetical protein AABP62_04695 [Planctomycetota bacterium]